MANEQLILQSLRHLLFNAAHDSMNPEAEALLAEVDAVLTVSTPATEPQIAADERHG